jgi:hypothetical protein
MGSLNGNGPVASNPKAEGGGMKRSRKKRRGRRQRRSRTSKF